MVSMSAPQGSAQAEGYLAKENYYQKNSERGFFHGHALEHFGLERGQEVTPELYKKMLNGYHPITGKALVKNAGEKDRRSGMDVTFSAPKSVSVLMEYHEAKGENSRAQNLRNAHDLAVKKAMETLEDRYAKTRIYNQFEERIRVKANLAYATFQHDTAREIAGQIDPQLHSHNFIFSTVSYDDPSTGKTKILSLSNEEIYQNKMYLGQLYRSEFAKNLRELGYKIEVSDRLNGFFEIEGFEKNQLEEFSGRSKLIRELLPQYKEKYPKMDENELLQVIVKDTKSAKKEVDREQLREQNLSRMEAVNIDDNLVENFIKNEPTKVENSHEIINDHLNKTLDNLTQKMSVFSHEDLLKESLKYGLEYTFNESDYREIIAQRVDIVQLDKNVFSTPKMIDAEKNIIKTIHAEREKSDHFSELNREDLAQFIDKNYANMTDGQRQMVEHIFTTNDRFIAVQGDAGSGKTYAAKAINEYVKEAFPGQEIIGIAYTGKAAEGLEKDSGISSQTVHSFLAKEQKKKGKDQEKEHEKSRVIIVDEASMIGSLQVNEIVEAAKHNNDKVVFIGDTKQFKSISAGRAFSDMQKYGIKTVHMTEVLRQESEFAKESVHTLKEQKVQETMELISKRGRLHEKNVSDQVSEVSERYAALRSKERKDTLIITSTNKERRELNQQIREKLGKKGSLHTIRENLSFQGMRSHYAEHYKEGYYVAIQGKLKGFKNGEQLQVIASNRETNTITVKGLDKKAKERDINVFEHGGSLQVYKETQKQFAKGDLIIFTKNTTLDIKSRKNVKNGERTYIKKIDKKGNILTENGKMFNIREMNYVDHGYAITDVKSQGTTVKDVIVMANSSMASMNSFYTQITRAKRDITVFTNNLDELKANIEGTKEDKSTLDYTIRIKEKQRESRPEHTIKSLMKGKEDGRSTIGTQEHIRPFDTDRETIKNDLRTVREAGKQRRELKVVKYGDEKRGHADKGGNDRTEQRNIGNIYDLGRTAKSGRSRDHRRRFAGARVDKERGSYVAAVDKINQKRRENVSRRRETIKNDLRQRKVRKLTRVGTLQSNLEATQGSTIRKNKHRVHGLSQRNMEHNKFNPKMLLQTDVSNSVGRGVRSNQSLRRQGDIHSHDAGRGIDVKASFKEYMKQSKGKDINVIDKAAAREPGREKKHNAETLKQFVKQKQNKQHEKGREIEK